MRIFLLLPLFLISSFGFGQEPVIKWQKSLGGSADDRANSIQQTTDGGYIIAGNSQSNDGDVTGNHGFMDYWVVRLDSLGNISWKKSFGGSSADQAESIQQTADGGYIVAGSSQSSDGDVTVNHGVHDFWIVKLNQSGNISWQKSLGGSNADVAESIQQTTDGGYIIAGQSQSNDGDVSGNHGSIDYWVVKIDSLGNILWQNSLGGSGADQGHSVQQTMDGGYIVAGQSDTYDFLVNGDVTGNHGGRDFWVVKLDSSGSISWEKSLGGSGSDWGESVQQTADGGYIVGGYTTSNDEDVTGNNGTFDYWVVRLDTVGNILWQNSLGGSAGDWGESVQQAEDGGFIITGRCKSDNGDVTLNNGFEDYWTIKLDTVGNITWQRSMGGSGRDEATSIQQTSDRGFILTGASNSMDGDVTGNHGNYDYWVVKIDIPKISGTIYNDLNENCILEPSEPGITGVPVIINPGGYIAQVNNFGLWYIDSLPIGTYTATIDTTNSNWTSTCPVSQTFTVTNPQTYTPGPDFGVVNNNPCSSPDISIHAPFLRRCFSDQVIYVQACNDITATGALNSAYADVELDSLLTPTSSSIPYTALGNDLYRFQLDTINPGQCVDFTINTTVSCNAMLDQTLCLDAKLFPVDTCALDTIPLSTLPYNYGSNPNLVMPQPCTLPWDNSSLEVEGWCQGDSVQFSITNTGDLGNGDMDCYSPVLLYVNDTLVNIDSIQLLGQETIYYSYPANGETWILAAEQHPLHPGNSHPNAHVELCGVDSSQWIPNMVNNYPHDDADPVDDIYCGTVSGSYDPNDKRGLPTGVTSQHHIQPNQQLQYVVRFQNTGTDTAFTVVIRDTLDTDLNIFTVNSGVSSHDYTFKKYGPRVLEWTFNDIMLPDSTTNEPGSNGFVTFTVDQVPDLPNGTVINNQADIYFDFNAPIITNETDHLIDDNIEGDAIGDFVIETISACSNYTWNANGQTYTQPGIYTTLLTNQAGLDSTVTLDLTIDTVNTSITQLDYITLEAVANNAQYQWVDCNQNYQPIAGANDQTFEATENGNYAAIVTQNGCSDTTACIIIDKVGLHDNTKEMIKVYPNPTSNSFTISSDVMINSAFKVIDTQGKDVLSGKMNGKEKTIGIAKLSKGTYSVVFEDSELPVLSVIKE